MSGFAPDPIALAYQGILRSLGEDPSRDGLRDTAQRVARSLRELTGGYSLDPGAILGTTFEEEYDEMVVVRDIEFWSLCEHHVLPFHGYATVGYIPQKRVVGLSKVARLVDMYAKRLQIQERMTRQIADALQEHLDPLGVGVVISATHTCMAMRGIRSTAPMLTSALLGRIREDDKTRAEFLSFRGRNGHH